MDVFVLENAGTWLLPFLIFIFKNRFYYFVFTDLSLMLFCELILIYEDELMPISTSDLVLSFGFPLSVDLSFDLSLSVDLSLDFDLSFSTCYIFSSSNSYFCFSNILLSSLIWSSSLLLAYRSLAILSLSWLIFLCSFAISVRSFLSLASRVLPLSRASLSFCYRSEI